ncbi:MAG: lipopolysaccharide kinase InaA family protein, partial [Bacteroidia bacterium]|nr:kinase [Bacteroidia bacterium]MDW8334746.1 lipopolysaccharide kinase InaA family protein [Bacteroidia bacterium]
LSRKGDKVAAFYRTHPGREALERLSTIVGTYRERILSQAYWRQLFCWPEALVEYKGRLGFTAPVYDPCFYFAYGSVKDDFLGLRGREKEGKWFASALHRFGYLDERERGDWRAFLRVCELIARAVRRLHAAGLAHSDLSYKNVLVDPSSVRACVIDIDGLVVPGKFPPEVAGTPDFIAPEVVATMHLPQGHAQKKTPSILTDRHALATMIYLYLFCRHPLRGGKVHHPNPVVDETLAMGTKALFIEHPTDASNRPGLERLPAACLPWADVERIPYTVSGPHLTPLFERAFIEGPTRPELRPTADEWEKALQHTLDLLLPCRNADCGQKFFVFDGALRPRCPFCDTPWTSGPFAYLHFYTGRNGRFIGDGTSLVATDETTLHAWHVYKHLRPDERLDERDAKPLAVFFRGGEYLNEWKMRNLALTDLFDPDAERRVAPGEEVSLSQGRRLTLCGGERLIYVQIVSAPDRTYHTVAAR